MGPVAQTKPKLLALLKKVYGRDPSLSLSKTSQNQLSILRKTSMPLELARDLFAGKTLPSRDGSLVRYEPPENNHLRLDSLEQDKELVKGLQELKGLNKPSTKAQYALSRLFAALMAESLKPYAPLSDAKYKAVFVYNAGTENLKIFKGANVDIPFGIRRCAEVNTSEDATKGDKLDYIFLNRNPWGLNDQGDKYLKFLRPEQLFPCNFCASHYVTDDFIGRGGKVFVVNKKKVLERATKDHGYFSKEVKDQKGKAISEPPIYKLQSGLGTFHFQVLGKRKLPHVLVEREAFNNVQKDRTRRLSLKTLESTLDRKSNLIKLSELLAENEATRV